MKRVTIRLYFNDSEEEELGFQDGRWFHCDPPDCRDEHDMERLITPAKARELLTKAKQRALRCLAAIQEEIARCEEFERLLNKQP